MAGKPRNGKQTYEVTTKPYPNGGRSVLVTEQNVDAINRWLEDSGDLTWVPGKASTHTPKFKIKTKKGLRVAVVGDTIVRYGSWRQGSKVTPYFEVVKKA